MKIRGRTCLIALCLIALCLPAGASPERETGACQVSLKMSAHAAFEDPLARWINQLCQLIHIEAQAARWDDGGQVQVSLRMGQHQAFTLQVLRLEGQTRFASSLTEGEVELPVLWTWPETLLKAGDQVVDLPRAGRLIPVSGEGVARALSQSAVSLRAWAALARAQACASCENCGECQACQNCLFAEGLAILADALADGFDETAFDTNVLLIDIEPVSPADLPLETPTQLPAAADSFTVDLIREAAAETAAAIVSNDPSILENP